MIPVEAIADVRARVDLVGFARTQGIELKRHGKGFLGLCPLHRDTAPSFSVDPDKQVWCCLGACSAGGKVLGGDVVELARRLWGVSLSEAVERLGGRTAAALPPRNGSRPPLRVLPRPVRPPAALLGQAAGLFHQTFAATPAARDYVAARGISDAAVLSALPIGYSDGSLLERAPEGSDTHEALKALGLVTAAGREHFSGCVVVPLRDLGGEVVGFYGRSVEGHRHLFLPGPRRGLVNAAGAATTDELILTEGVFDFLAFAEAGIPNAVPLYGTNGYTQDHAALLEKNRIRRVILALDADEAGRTAARALGEKLRGRGLEVLDVLLPAKDPSDLLLREGREGFATAWGRLVTEATRQARRGFPPAPAAPAEETDDAAKGRSTEAPGSSLTCEDGVYLLVEGPRTWRVQGLGAWGADRLRVTVRVEEAGRFHVDTFDLYSARSRESFVEKARKALRLSEAGEPALLESLLSLVDALEKERLALRKGKGGPETPTMSEREKAEAIAFLTGGIVAVLKADFRAVGLVGEEAAMLTGYLALVSRKLGEPLSVLFCARSGAGKSTLQDRLCDFCPPEDLVKYTRISGQVLFYKDEKALAHKLLAVDEEDGAAQAAYALRNLLSSGSLTCSVTRTDPQTGRQMADDRKVDGPTAVFLTSAHPEALDYETRNRFLLLTVDESREQTKRILELQRWSETLDGLVSRERRKAVYKRHHDAQRLLEPLPVVIPVDVAFPASWLILRREQKKYLGLIKAIALLHQHQRPRKTVLVDGRSVTYVEASEADVALARELAAVTLARNLDELSPPSRSLLRAIADLVAARRKAPPAPEAAEPGAPRRYLLKRGEEGPDERLLLDRHEIQRATGLSLWHVKTYLEQLVAFEYVALVTGRKGKRCLYELIWDGQEEPGLL
jgi:DNA primase catalytic core